MDSRSCPARFLVSLFHSHTVTLLPLPPLYTHSRRLVSLHHPHHSTAFPHFNPPSSPVSIPPSRGRQPIAFVLLYFLFIHIFHPLLVVDQPRTLHWQVLFCYGTSPFHRHPASRTAPYFPCILSFLFSPLHRHCSNPTNGCRLTIILFV